MSAIPEYLPRDGEPIKPTLAPRLLIEWEPRWRSFVTNLGPALGCMPYTSFHGGPSLLVRWERPWDSFTSALRPALARSERRLAGECTVGIRAGPGTFTSALLHLAALLCLLFMPLRVAQLNLFPTPTPELQYQVIYYSGNELPQMNDVGGARMGESGLSGGRELYHPTQTIRIARGSTKLVSAIVDAPRLKLPRTNEPVANLLTIAAGDPGPAPAAGMRSLMAAANLLPTPPAIPAAPNVKRAKLMATPQLAAGAVQAAPQAKREVAGLKMPAIGTQDVLPPPVSAPAGNVTSTTALQLPLAVAVAPPADLSTAGLTSRGIPGFGAKQDALPPAVQPGGQALTGSPMGALEGIGGGLAVAPMANAGVGANGLAGNSMKGSGASLRSTGSGTGGGGAGVVISSNPGSKVGAPGGSGEGAIAMSPAGGTQPGYGGSGGGTGIGRGTGPGSSDHGSGSGAGTSGTGLGKGALRAGISPYPGPGGSGSGKGSPIPGLTVIGGNVTLPGFTTPEDSSGWSRGNTDSRGRPPITIIATARSGGALPAYGSFHFRGAKVYTIYMETQLGPAVLQYAERAVSQTNFEQDLMPPEIIKADLPGVPRSRLLLSCILDQTGALTNIRVLDAARPGTSTAIVTALENWRFRPVLRGDQPVDVDVILGFAIDTR
ncbi:MAG: energy transducer TonB [Terriglobales bacterium]